MSCVISKIGFGSKRVGRSEFPMTDVFPFPLPLPTLSSSSTQRAAIAFVTQSTSVSTGVFLAEDLGLLSARCRVGAWPLERDPQFPLF